MFDQVEKGSGSSSSTAASNSDEDDRKTLLDEREQVRRLVWALKGYSKYKQVMEDEIDMILEKAGPDGSDFVEAITEFWSQWRKKQRKSCLCF